MKLSNWLDIASSEFPYSKSQALTLIMQNWMIIQWQPSYKQESFLCICSSLGPNQIPVTLQEKRINTQTESLLYAEQEIYCVAGLQNIWCHLV